MRRVTMLLLAIVLLTSGCSSRKQAKNDTETILGTWSLVSLEMGGKDVPEERAKRTKITLTSDGKFKTAFIGGEINGTYRLDASKQPKEITTVADGKSMAGIYELNEGDLKICFAWFGEERPHGFVTKAGSKSQLAIYRREKP
jgi:uncharacterized protein (TIGR03067 family)